MADLADIAIAPQELNDLLTGSEDLLAIDFWAPWCGTCRLMTSSILRLHRERSNDLRLVALNVEQDVSVAEALGVRSLPAVLFFRRGEEVRRLIGLRSYDNLSAEVDALLT